MDQDNFSKGSRTPQPIRKGNESRINGIGTILILNDLASSLSMVSCNKKLASVWQADGLTNFNPILTPTKNLQFYGQKSASVRQP